MIADDDVFGRLRAIVAKTFHCDAQTRIEPSTKSNDIDGWDSLSHSILIMEVEEEFAVSFELEEVYKLQTLGDLAALVQSERSKAASSWNGSASS